jgi:hypothetical protein
MLHLITIENRDFGNHNTAIFNTAHLVIWLLAKNQLLVQEHPWYSSDLVLCGTLIERGWFWTIEESQKNVMTYWKGRWKITSSNISRYSSDVGMCEHDDSLRVSDNTLQNQYYYLIARWPT